jgi:hypothetical protein
VNLPATSIGRTAFTECANLTTVNLPEATTIGNSAFTFCGKLTTVILPEAKETTIDTSAFAGCVDLTTVSAPMATSIGHSAFVGCGKLTTVSFPAAITIGGSAFQNCVKLTTVNLPAATSFGSQVFRSTGTESLTVTLGKTPPSLGAGLFHNVGASKTVTVEVPSDADTGYGTVPYEYSTNTTDVKWGNAFRGGGWANSAFVDGSAVNSNITLRVKHIGASN